MCGIIWVKRKDNINAKKSVLKRFEAQKTRGVDGFGFITIDKNKIANWYQAQDETGIKNGLNKYDTSEILFHHRFPTSTPNVLEATHPIKVSHESLKYDYYVVHNGVISNDDKLKEQYEKEGFVFTTKVKTITKKTYVAGERTYTVNDTEIEQYNDSECFAIDIAKCIENESVRTESHGSIAFIAIQCDKETGHCYRLYYGRNDRNPLKREENKHILSLTSAGTGEDVKADRLFCYDYETGETEDVHWLNIGGYDYGTNWDKKDKKNKDDIGFNTTRTYADSYYDDKYGDWDYDTESWEDYMKRKEKEEIKQNTLMLPSTVKINVEVVPAEEKGFHIISDMNQEGMWFENREDFEDYYGNLCEEIAEAEDYLRGAVALKADEEAEGWQGKLDYLNMEMTVLDSVSKEIYAKYN